MSDDLVAFINARLDEDEAAAQEAASRPGGPAWDDGTRHTAVARHINRHDPARVLREIAAKRAILIRREFARNQVAVGAVNESAGYGAADPGWPLRADSHELDARNLAAVWSDHPDWRPKWCLDCKDGLVGVGGCNCGSPADVSVGYAHESLCGWEPCPNGCWERLHPQPEPEGATDR